jgi:hypothetical protein
VLTTSRGDVATMEVIRHSNPLVMHNLQALSSHARAGTYQMGRVHRYVPPQVNTRCGGLAAEFVCNGLFDSRDCGLNLARELSAPKPPAAKVFTCQRSGSAAHERIKTPGRRIAPRNMVSDQSQREHCRLGVIVRPWNLPRVEALAKVSRFPGTIAWVEAYRRDPSEYPLARAGYRSSAYAA